MTVETEVAALTTAVNSLTSSVNVSKATLDESVAAAAAIYDSFDDRYLGAKSSAPSTDNDGNSLLTGALYFNSTENAMYVYTGASWVITTNYNNVTAPYTLAQTLNTNGNDVTFGDNGYATFGAGDDLQIYHDGGNSVIADKGVGDLYIQGSNTIRLTNDAVTEHYAKFNHNGGVELRHDNTIKFNTTATGIDVTGTATMDGLDIEGAGAGLANFYRASANANFSAITFKDTTNTNINAKIGWNANELRLDGTNNVRLVTDAKNRLLVSSGGDISFYEDTGTTAKLFWDASAESLGIGTSSPAAKLDVSGNALIQGRLQITAATPELLFSVPSAGLDSRIHNDGSGNFIFGTGTNSTTPTERMRIDATGNTTITAAGNPTLTVKGNAGAYSSFLVLQAAAGGGSTINATGATSSYLNFQVDGSNKMRISSAGNVGIGTTSPDTLLELVGADPILTIRDTETSGAATNATLRLAESGASDTLNNYWDINHTANSALSFKSQIGSTASEAMRIDSAGNVLVGTTDSNVYNDATGTGTVIQSNGIMQLAANNGTPLYANRQGTDGTIVDFRKDGDPVGSIGTFAGGTYIGTGTTGIRFSSSLNAIIPVTSATGAGRGSAIDLGYVSGSTVFDFKDLYLSGGVYLGGTGAANKLDDYEEGTWTPTLGGGATATGMTGTYTKVGRLVTAHLHLENSTISGTPNYIVSGLPFTSINSRTPFAVTYFKTFNIACESVGGFVAGNTDTMQFLGIVQGSPWVTAPLTEGTGRYAFVTAVYQTS